MYTFLHIHEYICTCTFILIHISTYILPIICITDIASAQILQTLRGHIAPILSLLFDSTRICTISADNTVRYWRWGEEHDLEDKIHILAQNETLIQIAKLYNITLEELMRWNGIYDARRQIDMGHPLIVKKVRNTIYYTFRHLHVYTHFYILTYTYVYVYVPILIYSLVYINLYIYIYVLIHKIPICMYLLTYTYYNTYALLYSYRAIRTSPPKQRK